MTRPRPCATCGINPIAYVGRKHCYQCVPRVWQRPVRCKRCGSGSDYFTAGLCRRCHRSGPWPDSCLDCLAWGVTRRGKWLCQACQGWRHRYRAQPRRRCPACQRWVVVNHRGYCRLCCRQATLVRTPHRPVDGVRANRGGQQLFFADLILKQRGKPSRSAPPPPVIRAPSWPAAYPVAHRQLALFDWPADLSRLPPGWMPIPPLPELAAALDRAVTDHAARHGWSKTLREATCRAIRVLLATQPTPGAPITASQAAALAGLPWVTAQPALDILATAGMLDDDRPPPLEAWFATQTATLAEPMATEVRLWFHALRDGSTSPPRSHPRNLSTVRHRIADVTDALHTWTDAGHRSLREITPADVINVLPAQANQHKQLLESLRSLFRFLKARRLTFTNPTAQLRAGQPQLSHPLPIDLQLLRQALDSTNPATATLAALVAFHALRNHQLRALRLTDICDGRLLLPDRTVPLADPVRDRLTAWLDHRARRWPHTLNPHLFINHYTAVRTCTVSGPWITNTLGISAQAIREDRILHEAIATDGDVRRLADFFGLTVGGAVRYLLPAEPQQADSSK